MLIDELHEGELWVTGPELVKVSTVRESRVTAEVVFPVPARTLVRTYLAEHVACWTTPGDELMARYRLTWELQAPDPQRDQAIPELRLQVILALWDAKNADLARARRLAFGQYAGLRTALELLATSADTRRLMERPGIAEGQRPVMPVMLDLARDEFKDSVWLLGIPRPTVIPIEAPTPSIPSIPHTDPIKKDI